MVVNYTLSEQYICRHNINYLYHMTAISNLRSIFEHGLLSHNEAHRLGIITDISAQNVQNLRSMKRVKSISLHNYVPFYFSPFHKNLNSHPFVREVNTQYLPTAFSKI